MNVLHVDSGVALDGGQYQVLFLMEGLLNRRVKCRLLARGALLAEAQRRGWDAGELRWGRYSADIVHAHDARTHTMAAVLARGRVVVSRRVGFPVKANPLSRWKYRRPATFLAVSHFAANELLRAGVPASKVAVVADGVPDLPRSQGGRIITISKNRALTQQAAKLARVPVIVSTNPVEDLATASMLVYASDMEGLGSAALLAMSAGVPVVASRVGGLREAVENGVTGWLVPNTATAFAAAIRQLVNNEDQARHFGAAGRARYEANYTVPMMVERTLAEYRRVLG